MKRGAAGVLVGMGAALLGGGCDDLDRFSTGEGEAYCGSVTLGSGFRTGLSPRVQMRLEIDAGALDGGEPPGTLSTFEAGDDEQPERRLLDEAALRPIKPLVNDPLSRLEFGEGRERNAMFAVSAASAEAEGLLAIVSFRTDDSIEVRLIRPGVAAVPGGEAVEEGRRPIFGIFPLTKREGDCGF